MEAAQKAKDLLKDKKNLIKVATEARNVGLGVQKMIGENEAIRSEVQRLADKLLEGQKLAEAQEKERVELAKKLEAVKDEFRDIAEARKEKEIALERRCKEALAVLNASKAELAQQVESLEVQLEAKNIQESVMWETEEQRKRAELVYLEGQISDIAIKIEQLRFQSRQFLKTKEREQNELKKQWDEKMSEREKLASEMESLKSESKEKENEVRRLKEQIKSLEQDEKIVNFEVDCIYRDKKYGLPKPGSYNDRTKVCTDSGSTRKRDEVDDQLDEVVSQAKDKLRQMSKVISLMAQIDHQVSRRPLTETDSVDIETMRSQAGQIIRDIFSS